MLSQPLLLAQEEVDQRIGKNPCKLCLGTTPPPLHACNCPQNYIHQSCLRIEISKQLKYHRNTIIKCEHCSRVVQYRFNRRHRLRTANQLCLFFYQNVLPELILCLLLWIGLALNESCLNRVQPTSFWMKLIRVYLVLVGIYLEMLFLFLIYFVYEACKEEFMVRDYQPDNIILL